MRAVDCRTRLIGFLSVRSHRIAEFLLESDFIRKLAFPHNNDPPTLPPERRTVALVTLNVTGELRAPELDARLWHNCISAAVMPVPEAAVHKHDSPSPRKDDIRFARQVSASQRKPKA